ncbi:Hypothetical protein CINCED_3A004276 [Cinara cedri]|uniref:Uncharacterized protein n=1 Tax=Cinara cedri TaxID=506608 RepID=A0A5E4MM12_9HEMI|nr:Hypothetical protein CINCED_3A004276 [Cinara cedri]
MMKFLLCLTLVCTVVIADPEPFSSVGVKNETVLNHRFERNDIQQFPIVQTSAKSEEKELRTETKADLNTDANDKSRLSYASTISQVNPSTNPPQLTSIHINQNYPARSMSENYGSTYRSYDSLGFPGSVYSSYPSSPSYGLGSSGYSRLYGLSAGLPDSCGPLISSVIPTSYSNAIPYRGGINIAQQIIHKPIITELQEVIHKPVITEIQEIVNKPVISEVQQIVHKPLYTEHIGLGPSYHGYQKHIVKQPTYENPTKHFVRQPIYHTETIHLADEYENAAVNTNTVIPSNCESGSSYGTTVESALSAVYAPGLGAMQPGALFAPQISMPNITPYGPIISSASSVPTGYSPLLSNSKPLYYARVPSAQTLNKYTGQTPIGYSTPTSFRYSSLPSYGYTSGSSLMRQPNEQQTTIFNTNYDESYKNIKEKTQPLNAEQLAYDQLVLYKQHLNNYNNQQYYGNQLHQPSELQQSWGRTNEDSTQIKMDVDAIAKQIEENPEMKKLLLKIITERMYVSGQTKQSNKQLDKSM